MNVLDLFSGIGGFSLGLERAGMRTVAFCEIEKYCRQVLAKHWPGVPIYEDIRRLTAERLRADGIGPVDLVCGGFPCQPFSHAGKRRGKEDDRDLWPEMFRVIQETRPAWVLGENVAGFVNMELERSFSDLESEGYEVEAVLVPACGVDAPHPRERVWIIAHAVGDSRSSGLRGLDRGRAGAESPDGCPKLSARHTSMDDSESSGSGFSQPEHERSSQGEIYTPGGASSILANTSSERSGEANAWRMCSRNAEEKPGSSCDGEALPNPNLNQRHGRGGFMQMGRGWSAEEIERDVACAGTQWRPEPGLGRVAHGVPHRVDRLRGLGNAVVPQVVKVIGRAIMVTQKEMTYDQI